MLEGRIKLQKSLTLCNQLPQPDTVSLYSNSPNIEPNVQNCKPLNCDREIYNTPNRPKLTSEITG